MNQLTASRRLSHSGRFMLSADNSRIGFEGLVSEGVAEGSTSSGGSMSTLREQMGVVTSDALDEICIEVDG
jgi:hypothetical protein